MKSKKTETAVHTLLGFIVTKIAKLTGFQRPEEIPLSNWKIIPQLWWLKIQIAFQNLQTFLVGSSTDENLCCRRWEYLIGKIREHKELGASISELTSEYETWFNELIELEVDAKMTWHEMEFHRTGRQQYSYSRGDMSEHHIAALPEWWFDGTRAKRKLRELNDQ